MSLESPKGSTATDGTCPNYGLAPHGPCTGWRPDDDQPLTVEQERAADDHFNDVHAEPAPEQVIAYPQFVWDCGACGAVNTLEHDPAGEVVSCEECDSLAKVVETR